MRFRFHLVLLFVGVGTWTPTMAAPSTEAGVDRAVGGGHSSLGHSESAPRDPPGLSGDRRELASDVARADKQGAGQDAAPSMTLTAYNWYSEPPYKVKWTPPSNDTTYIWLGNDNTTTLGHPIWLGAVPSSVTKFTVTARPQELKFDTHGWYIQLTGDRTGSHVLVRTEPFSFDTPPDPYEQANNDFFSMFLMVYGIPLAIFVGLGLLGGMIQYCSKTWERVKERWPQAREQDDNHDDDEQGGVQLNPLRRDGYDRLDTEDSNV